MVQDSAPPANRPLASLAPRYRRLLAHADAAERELARRQLAALDRLAQRQRAPTARASVSTGGCFAHVPIADLFERAGNRLQVRGNTARCGHEPVHSSRSGTCAVLWLNENRYWCSSCHQGGDVVAALMSLEGVAYREAQRRLAQRYGLGNVAANVAPTAIHVAVDDASDVDGSSKTGGVTPDSGTHVANVANVARRRLSFGRRLVRGLSVAVES